MTTVYSVRAPDGTILDIEGPDGATDEQIAAFAAQQFGAPVDAAPELAPDAFNAEVRRRAQAGEDAQAIRDWAATVKNPASPALKYTIGPELEQVVENVRGGSTRPVNIEDVTKPDAIMAALRGAADTFTFKSADELEAMVRSGAISGPEYEAEVNRQRALRANDARYNSPERLAGEAVGAVGQGLLAAGGQAALAARAPVAAFLENAGLGAKVGLAATAGATGSTLNSLGAAQSMDEFSERGMADATIGAAQGAAIPVVGSVVAPIWRELRTIFSSDYAANRALADANIDWNRVTASAEDFFKREGRTPALAEVLTPFESGQLTRALSRSGKAAEKIQARADEYVQGARKDIRGWIGAPSRLDNPNLGIPTAVPGRKPYDKEEYLEEEILRAENPEIIRQRANVIADKAFAPFREETFVITDEAQTALNRIFPKLSGSKFDEIKARAEKGEMTLGDADMLRRSLNKAASAPLNPESPALREWSMDLSSLMAEQQPKTREAVANMAKFMRAAEGAEVGLYGVKPGTELSDFVSAMARLTAAERAGVPTGAREGLVAMTRGKASDIENFARRLTENGGDNGYFDRIANVTSPEEAASLLETATRFKSGIDSLAALAKIPDDKVASTLDSVEGIVRLMAAPVSGGAAKAGIANAILDRTNIGKDAADKLAERLLNPDKRREAIAAVGNLTGKNGKKIYGDVKNVLRNALFSFSMGIGKDNARPPENRPEDRPQ